MEVAALEHGPDGFYRRLLPAEMRDRLRGDDAHVGPVVVQAFAQLRSCGRGLVPEDQAAGRGPIAEHRMRIVQRRDERGQVRGQAVAGLVRKVHDAFQRIGSALRVLIDRFVAGQSWKHAFRDEAGVPRGEDFRPQRGAQPGDGRGVLRFRDAVAQFERIIGQAIKLLGGFRLPVGGLDFVAAAGQKLRVPGTHAGQDLERIGIVLTPGAMRRVIPYVAEPAVTDRADRVVPLVHAAAEQEHVLARRGLLFAEERAAFVMAGNRYAAQAEHRGGQVHKADQVVYPRARLGRCEVRPLLGEPDDQRHARPGIMEIALAARQRAAVVAVGEHDGVVGESLVLQFRQQLADLLIQQRQLVVVVGPVAADVGRVGMVGRQGDLFRRHAEGSLARLGRDLAFVAGGEVEYGEERLAGRPVLEMRPVAALVPRLARMGDVVVGLGVVRAVVTRRAEVFRVEFELGRDRHAAAVVVDAQRRGVHARDQRRPRAGTDRSVGKGVAVTHALRRQPVEVRRVRQRVTVTAQVRAVVLTGDPQDVGPLGGVQQTAEERGADRDRPRAVE